MLQRKLYIIEKQTLDNDERECLIKLFPEIQKYIKLDKRQGIYYEVDIHWFFSVNIDTNTIDILNNMGFLVEIDKIDIVIS